MRNFSIFEVEPKRLSSGDCTFIASFIVCCHNHQFSALRLYIMFLLSSSLKSLILCYDDGTKKGMIQSDSNYFCYVFVGTHKQKHTNTQIYMYTCIYIFLFKCLYIYIYIYIYIYKYMIYKWAVNSMKYQLGCFSLWRKNNIVTYILSGLEKMVEQLVLFKSHNLSLIIVFIRLYSKIASATITKHNTPQQKLHKIQFFGSWCWWQKNFETAWMHKTLFVLPEAWVIF